MFERKLQRVPIILQLAQCKTRLKICFKNFLVFFFFENFLRLDDSWLFGGGDAKTRLELAVTILEKSNFFFTVLSFRKRGLFVEVARSDCTSWIAFDSLNKILKFILCKVRKNIFEFLPKIFSKISHTQSAPFRADQSARVYSFDYFSRIARLRPF